MGERDVVDCQHIKKSRLKLDQITNDLLPDLVIVLWRMNVKSIACMEEHRCRHSCCSCTSRHKNRVVEIVVVHFVQFVLFQRFPKNKHPMPLNFFELVVASFFWSSAMVGVIKSYLNNLWSFKSFSFWWSSAPDDLQLLMNWASGELLLRRVFLMTSASSKPLFFRCFLAIQASFLLIPLLSFVLSEPNNDTEFFVYGLARLNKY